MVSDKLGLAEGSDAGAEGRHRAGTMISIWEPAFGGTLTQTLEGLGFEEQIQLVFFHPMYTFRDGKARLGGDDATKSRI